MLCYNRSPSPFWPYRLDATKAAVAYDNLHQGREASPEGAIEKIVDRLMDFANDESPSPPWVCFYDEVFKLPPGATVKDLRAEVWRKADELKERKDPVALMKFCLKLHDLARD